MLVFSTLQLLDLLGQGLGPELKPVVLQGTAHARLQVQLQVLLLLVKYWPVEQAITIGVPVNMPSKQGGVVVTLSPTWFRSGQLAKKALALWGLMKGESALI